jgi:hypothetical protein
VSISSSGSWDDVMVLCAPCMENSVSKGTGMAARCFWDLSFVFTCHILRGFNFWQKPPTLFLFPCSFDLHFQNGGNWENFSFSSSFRFSSFAWFADTLAEPCPRKILHHFFLVFAVVGCVLPACRRRLIDVHMHNVKRIRISHRHGR